MTVTDLPLRPISERLRTPNITWNISEVNSMRTEQLIPIMVYLAILSLIGMIGNAFVIYLFSTKFKKATSSAFIVWLAVLDILVCSVGMPFEIVDMVFIYTFTIGAYCKTFRFFIFAIVYSSALTLIVVALDRFIKVCYPLKGWKIKPIRTLAITTLVGFIIAIPVALVYGTTTTTTIYYNLNGTECSITDDMHNTKWPVVYYASLSLVFVISITSLAVLYGKLVYTLFKRKRQMRRDSAWFQAGKDLRSEKADEQNLFMDKEQNETTNKGPDDGYESDGANDKINSSLRRKKTKKLRKIFRIRRRSNAMNYPGYFNIPAERTSIIFACVSAGFIISYLPSLMIIILREINKNIENKYLYSSRASDICYNLFLRSYFLNHAINPVIYGFLNPSFRNACIKLVCPCVKVKEPDQVDAPLDSSSALTSTNV